MDKNSKPAVAGTESMDTVEYKVQKLTPRRIKMITKFLAKTTKSSGGSEDSFGSVAWMDRLIEFLHEPKPCRSTKKDIIVWLKNDCFKKSIDKVILAAKRAQPRPETMEEPMVAREDIGKQTLPSLDAIQTEREAKEDDIEEQGLECDDPMATGNEEETWGPSAIMEEAEMETVMETLELDDVEFPVNLSDIKSENQDPTEEIPIAEFDMDQDLDQTFNWSGVALGDGMLNGEQMDQDTNAEKLENAPIGNDDGRVSSEDNPVLTAYTHNDAPNEAALSESTATMKKTSDTLFRMVQNLRESNDVSRDWDSVYHSLCIIKATLKNVK